MYVPGLQVSVMAQSKESGGAYNVHLISGSQSVTVTGITLGQCHPKGGSSVLPTAARRVVVTPLTSTSTPANVSSQNTAARPQLISKILIKAFYKGNKKDSKIFTLRNINPGDVSSVDKLEQVIRDQLHDDISRSDFEVGYLQGSNVVTIRNKDDLVEVWSNVKKGTKVILWCDGLKKKSASGGKNGQELTEDDEEIQEVRRRRKRAKSDEEDGQIRKKRKKNEDKDKKVQATIDLLNENHGDKAYTPMQYRVWTEMHLGGVHPSFDTPPTSSMFVRAGGGSVKKKTGQASNVGEVVSAIGELTSALSPRLVPPSVGTTAGNSPAKVIDNRTKCYKQLSDLKSLFESGILSEEEYSAERCVILGMLKKLV